MSKRRQEIIDRALKLFNEKGFHDVSIKQIADSLSISPGNLTYYFTKNRFIKSNSASVDPGNIDRHHAEWIYYLISF